MIIRCLLIMLLASIVIGCKKKVLEEKIAEKTNANLQFFGYTLIDVGWDDPTDKTDKTNYIDEVSNFSNIADILVVTPSDNILERIGVFEEHSVKPVIHLNEIFFEQVSVGGDKSGVIYGLRSDYKERWDTFTAANDLNTNASRIACLYIGEEPAWNGIVEADFEEACNYAKLTVPTIPIFNVEAFTDVDNLYTPASVDWVGFDHYFLKQPSLDVEFMNEFNVMKSKMKNHQKIVLIMDAHWIKIFHGSSGIAKNDMDFIARDYYNLANSDTSIVGILGYFWPSGFDFKKSIGTRGLPKHVLEEHKSIGKIITGK